MSRKTLQEVTKGTRLLAAVSDNWIESEVRLGALLRIAEATEQMAEYTKRVAAAAERIADQMPDKLERKHIGYVYDLRSRMRAVERAR